MAESLIVPGWRVLQNVGVEGEGVGPLGARVLFGLGLAAYGKTDHDSPFMLRQEERLDEASQRCSSPDVFGPMKPVHLPSRHSVRAAIAAALYHGDAALQRTALQLGVSPRSLQRHLAAMGSSYSDMVAEVRLDTACHLLLDSNERISAIALRLGYAGTSSFSRVFMRLTKMQPGIYRRERAVQGGDKSRPGPRKGKRQAF